MTALGILLLNISTTINATTLPIIDQPRMPTKKAFRRPRSHGEMPLATDKDGSALGTPGLMQADAAVDKRSLSFWKSSQTGKKIMDGSHRRLTVYPNGTIKGTDDSSTNFSLFRFISVTTLLSQLTPPESMLKGENQYIMILGMNTNKYICAKKRKVRKNKRLRVYKVVARNQSEIDANKSIWDANGKNRNDTSSLWMSCVWREGLNNKHRNIYYSHVHKGGCKMQRKRKKKGRKQRRKKCIKENPRYHWFLHLKSNGDVRLRPYLPRDFNNTHEDSTFLTSNPDEKHQFSTGIVGMITEPGFQTPPSVGSNEHGTLEIKKKRKGSQRRRKQPGASRECDDSNFLSSCDSSRRHRKLAKERIRDDKRLRKQGSDDSREGAGGSDDHHAKSPFNVPQTAHDRSVLTRTRKSQPPNG